MTDREKAFAIYGYSELLAVKRGLGEHFAVALSLRFGKQVGIREELVARAKAEALAFDKIARLATNWPVVGLPLARRGLKKARTRGAIAMTDREIAITLTGISRVAEAQSGKPSGEFSSYVEWMAWAFRIGEGTSWAAQPFVAQLNQEISPFIDELEAIAKREGNFPT